MLLFGQTTEDRYGDVFGGNVNGVVFTMQKALPLLKNGSSVILTGLIVGVEGNANFGIYSVSKAAVRNLARSGKPIDL
jgi:NAD(P)-dependent dehydrogenase (short-subunit alcohol dehydrogenase family)